MEWIKIGKNLAEKKLIDFYNNVFPEWAIQQVIDKITIARNPTKSHSKLNTTPNYSPWCWPSPQH